MEICNIDSCTGCSACAQGCPKGAITMKKNAKGFLHPVIDDTLCIKCGKCTSGCHINSDINYNEVKEKYLFRHKDFSIRKNSSSGAAFPALVKVVLDRSGIVFGAKFDDDLVVMHDCYDDNNVEKLYRSKYVQSDINNSYIKVKNELEKGRLVLFSGTPCQVSGLNQYLRNSAVSTDKLLTVDFICHGVGSPRFWENSLNYYEQKYRSKPIDANFRGKLRPGKTQNLILTFANGKIVKSPSANFEIYFYHFIHDYIIRESCFECRYAKVNRVSDITLGDCFSPKGEVQHLADGFGLSQLMANTEKGKKYLEAISEFGEMVEVSKADYIQPTLQKPTKKPNDYNDFWKEYLSKGYKGALSASGYLNAKNRIKHMILYVAYYLRLDATLKKIARRIQG